MKNRYDTLKIVTAVILVTTSLILCIYALSHWEDNNYRELELILAIVFMVPAAVILNRYSSRYVASVLKKVIGRLFEVVVKAVNKIRNAFSMTGGSYKGVVHIKNYTDETIDIKGDKRSKSRHRFKRWRDMENNERVRFVYYKRMVRNIKGGFDYKGQNTPAENGRALIRAGKEKEKILELVSCYNRARYQRSAQVPDEEVNKLKKEFLK